MRIFGFKVSFAYFLPLLIVIAIGLGYMTNFYFIPTVEEVDLEKFSGLWYEHSRLPVEYERGCAANTTFFFKLQEDKESFTVMHKCLKADGKKIEKVGQAWLEDDKSRGNRLRISFTPILRDLNIFGKGYYVLLRDIKYQYALIGSPDMKNLWILSRKKRIKKSIYQRFINKAKDLGYKVEPFILTQHIETPKEKEQDNKTQASKKAVS